MGLRRAVLAIDGGSLGMTGSEVVDGMGWDGMGR